MMKYVSDVSIDSWRSQLAQVYNYEIVLMAMPGDLRLYSVYLSSLCLFLFSVPSPSIPQHIRPCSSCPPSHLCTYSVCLPLASLFLISVPFLSSTRIPKGLLLASLKISQITCEQTEVLPWKPLSFITPKIYSIIGWVGYKKFTMLPTVW